MEHEYVRADDDRIELQTTVEADWEGPPAEQIRDALVDIDDSITEWRTTGRELWPDTELEGVKVDATGPVTAGLVTPTRIAFTTPGTANGVTGYRLLAQWFDETELAFPELNEFRGKRVKIETPDDWDIEEDETRWKRRDPIGKPIAEIAGRELVYSAAGADAAVALDPLEVETDPVPVTVIDDVMAAFLDDDRLYLVDQDGV